MLSIQGFTRVVVVSLLLLGAEAAMAGNVSIPNTFTAHTPAVASQVNANFNAVATAVNGSATDIANLQAALLSVQNQLATQQSTINTLTSQLAAVQGSTVMALDANLAIVDVPDPNNAAILYRTVQFHDINVQVVNGTGNEETRNGLGNLVVGYNPINATARLACSIGEYSDQTTCQSNGGSWARNQRSGSHNLIVGRANAYSQYGGLVAGADNVANGIYASVSGGYFNVASGEKSAVSGGIYNEASGLVASVSGGDSGKASSDFSAVSGGYKNTASASHSSVSGGYSNTASGSSSSVSGGDFNTAGANNSSISGGYFNAANGDASSVCGGRLNIASNFYSTVSGGFSNSALGNYSSVSGGNSNAANGDYSSVSGGASKQTNTSAGWRAGSVLQEQ